ncbi:alpha-hydroxy-acid oxidizing protein [Methanobrevibacter sp. OttesenSCG-928-I08]|nr:alpha-hydroxy-acid oxidizing protein [Methanobrevibacter sp. OttesenSCG-928-I08]
MIYRCPHCGHIYDEDMEGEEIEKLSSCPVCHNPIEDFEVFDGNTNREIYQCMHCGHIFDETMQKKKITELEDCPVCHNSINDFKFIDGKSNKKIYKCLHCGYVYDENQEDQKLEDLGHCPACKTSHDNFEELKEENNIYKCPHCGYVYDENQEDQKLEDLGHCPICKNPADDFKLISNEGEESKDNELNYPRNFAQKDPKNRYMDVIHQISTTGKSIDSSMKTELELPSWDDILILANQLNPMPLDDDVDVDTKTIIGKNAKKPLVIGSPFFISHMSFGALSSESKIALSKGTASIKTAIGSGEGGILPEEMKNAYKYIFEYVPNKYSLTPENLKNVDAIEIKIGQGTKPGLGGHLPGEKVTEEIAKLRNKPLGEDIKSPSKFSDINSKEDLKLLVNDLRVKSEGRPIGIKIAPGKLEKDLEFILFAEPDFITIDGRGGATASSPLLIKDATTIPTIYALHRARKFLDENNSDIDLIITGGLRVSSDFAKALAMGADAIAIATAPLMSIACQQYKQCQIGQCPMGITTQNKELRERFESDKAIKRLENYLITSLNELKTFGRITGHKNIHDLNLEDIATYNKDISEFTYIGHV